MKFGRWLIMAVLASFTAVLLVSSVAGQGLRGANSAVIFDYEVTNDGGILFADEFDRLGGVDTLGYPASYRFELDGFTYQVTQRALLQWRSNIGVAYLGNIFEMLEHAGLDQWLLESKGIPLPIKDDGSNGDWNKARETRLSWLTNEQIKAKFLANPNPDAISDWNVDSAINLYGLPMSMPERHGPFISQRFQRVAFQLWVDEVAGSPAPGTVIGVLAGDLLKEAGLVPSEGLHVDERPVVVVAPAPAPAPAPSTSQPRATAKPRATATAKPEATAEATPEATPVTTPIAAEVTLASLTVGDTGISPELSADVTDYTSTVANEVESITVTADATSADATVEITSPADADGNVDGHQVALAEGPNTVTIVVTSGETTQTYTLTINRASAVPVEGAMLLTLSLSDVSLSPAFSGGTTEYTASVVHGIDETTLSYTIPTDARIGITPADADPDDNNAETTDDAGWQVTLNPASGGDGGTTTINIAVTAGDATTFYKIVITRGAAAADATLGGLSLGTGVTLDPAFSRHTSSYKAQVANNVASVTVEPTDNTEAAATYEYRSDGGLLGSGATQAVQLTADAVTTITVKVTSEDGKNSRTYTIGVKRLGGGEPTDTTLASLSLTDIELDQEFDPSNRGVYTATVEFADAATNVVWAVNGPSGAEAAVTVNGVAGPTGGTGNAPAALVVGENFIKVTVTGSDQNTVGVYDITVTRQKRVLGTDATLASITISNVTLDPAFKKDVFEYSDRVESRTLTVDVSATVTDTDTDTDTDGPDGAATFTVSPIEADDTEAPFTVTLNEGDNTITITVTAEDGTTTKVYTITVTREGTTGGDDATMGSLTLTDTTDDSPANHKPISLTPSFSRQQTSYTATVPFTTTEVTIGGRTNIAAAGFDSREDQNNDGDVDDGGEVLTDNERTFVDADVGDFVIVVRVTTTAGSVTKDYTITVTRQARVKSSDASLSALGVEVDNSAVTLLPGFDKGTRVYSAEVPYGDAEELVAEVTATVTDTDEANAVISPADSDAGTGGHQVDLVEGDNDISVEVTAEDGTKQTYTITLTRTVRSTDSSLSELGLKVGEDDVAFNTGFTPSTLMYSASVESTVTTVSLTATRSSSTAAVPVVVLNGNTGSPITAEADGTYNVTLVAGRNVIDVTVTAENPANTTEYRITVTKAS